MNNWPSFRFPPLALRPSGVKRRRVESSQATQAGKAGTGRGTGSSKQASPKSTIFCHQHSARVVSFLARPPFSYHLFLLLRLAQQQVRHGRPGPGRVGWRGVFVIFWNEPRSRGPTSSFGREEGKRSKRGKANDTHFMLLWPFLFLLFLLCGFGFHRCRRRRVLLRPSLLLSMPYTTNRPPDYPRYSPPSSSAVQSKGCHMPTNPLTASRSCAGSLRGWPLLVVYDIEGGEGGRGSSVVGAVRWW